MKDKTATIIIGVWLIVLSIVTITQWFFLHDTWLSVEAKVDELKPKETKTIEDYHNLIDDSKNKIDELAHDKWLKVSDIIDKCKKYYLPEIYIKEDKWRELLKKAEDSTFLLWSEPKSDSATLVDVRIGVTAEQIIKALQSIDPNEYIRPKPEEDTKEDIWQITINEE